MCQGRNSKPLTTLWFAGIDVCNILEYAMPSNIIKNSLDEDERKLTNLRSGSGQSRRIWIANEFGLYSLILSSSKPEAKTFKGWVTHDVLPSIRKAGIFTTQQAKEHEFSLQAIADYQLIFAFFFFTFHIRRHKTKTDKMYRSADTAFQAAALVGKNSNHSSITE